MPKPPIRFEDLVLFPFLNAVTQYSDRPAFYIDEQFYSYREFGDRVASIQSQVRSSDCETNLVGLVINNDLDTYASIFALWLDGKGYVPLHPHWPIERCQEILRQIEIRHILDSSPVSRYTGYSVMKPINHSEQIELPNTPDAYPADALAYILFTSGSTGKPKGVQISRQNVAAFLDSFWKTGIIITEEDRCLQCFDLSFDVSVQSFLVALTRGACVYTVPYGQMKFMSVAGLIDEQKLTFGAMAPSTLRYLQPYFEELDFSPLKQCILTAEASQSDLVLDWLKYAPGTTVYDFYGPTEGTVYATFYKFKGDGTDATYNGIISIGKPLANVQAVILDENGTPLPVGQKGELCIAGPQITPGYWADPQKNKEAFFNLVINDEMTRFYHTGDLCFQDNEGNILYSGRIDNQAKVQGFRVELSEIEFHAHQFLQRMNTVCVVYQNDKQLDEIAMFIESPAFDTAELIKYLRSRMPRYMIPAQILFLDKFPINANGKIDRKSIKSNISCK